MHLQTQFGNKFAKQTTQQTTRTTNNSNNNNDQAENYTIYAIYELQQLQAGAAPALAMASPAFLLRSFASSSLFFAPQNYFYCCGAVATEQGYAVFPFT